MGSTSWPKQKDTLVKNVAKSLKSRLIYIRGVQSCSWRANVLKPFPTHLPGYF